MRNVAMGPIEKSLPDAVGAWVHWLRAGSSLTSHGAPRGSCEWGARGAAPRLHPLPPLHEDSGRVTRPYGRARRAACRTCSWAGKSFHDREEMETLRAALAAVEWPEDALNVYAAPARRAFRVR